MNPDWSLYCYKAKVVKVYDGDTITVDIDLGFGVWLRKQKIRLLNIDAPEIRGEDRAAGLAARNHLRLLLLDKDVIVHTHKDRKGKYGRWLAEVYYGEHLESANVAMVQDGFAEYRGK